MTTPSDTPTEYRCKDSWGVDVVSAEWADAQIAALEAKLEQERTAREEAERLYRSQAAEYKLCRERLMIRSNDAAAAEQRLAAVFEDTRERCAKVCERRAETRFFEFGTVENDTNAGYYEGAHEEEYELRDEEDNDCAAAIRALTAAPGEHGDTHLRQEDALPLSAAATLGVHVAPLLALADELERTGRQGDSVRIREILGRV